MLPKDEFDAMVRNTEAVKRWVILLTVGALLLFAGKVIAATYGLQDGSGNKLTLHDEPCSIGFLKGWKRASFRYEGKDLVSCWMASQGVVYVLDDTGDMTRIPVTAFTKMQEG